MPPQSEWKPQTEVEWQPQTERTPVKAHSRAKRGRLGATIGGFAGGLAGKPFGGPLGSIPGAGVLGSAGEAAEELIRGEGLQPGQIAQAGGEQAAYEALGGVLGKGARVAGKGAMRLALRATPEVAQTAIREGITATGRGLTKLVGRIRVASDAEQRIVKGAAGQGIGWTDPVDFIRPVFQQVAKKLEGAPATERAKLANLYDDFLREHNQDISPLKILALRKYNDARASAIRKVVERGGVPKGSVRELWHEALGNQARATLQKEIPEIAQPEVFQRLTGKASIPSDLQKLREVAFPATRKSGTLLKAGLTYGAGPAAGATVGALTGGEHRGARIAEGAALGGLLSHPAVLSQLALMGQSPLLAALLSQAPRAAGAAIP